MMQDEIIYTKTQSGKLRSLATIVSHVVNPVFSGLFLASFLTLHVVSPRSLAVKWMLAVAMLVIIPPLLYVAHLVKTGYLEDIYMPDRSTRLKPLSVISVWLVISFIVLQFFNLPMVMTVIMVATIAMTALLSMITALWKISFHSAVIMTAASFLGLMHNEWMWAILPLVPLVGWARVYLKRHTLMQVIGGIVAGGVTTLFVYTIAGYFIQI